MRAYIGWPRSDVGRGVFPGEISQILNGIRKSSDRNFRIREAVYENRDWCRSSCGRDLAEPESDLTDPKSDPPSEEHSAADPINKTRSLIS